MNFWAKVLLTTFTYFIITISLDYFWEDAIYSKMYFIKKIIGPIIWGFIFSLLASSENPFRKKKTSP